MAKLGVVFTTLFHGVDVIVSVCVLLSCLLHVTVSSTNLVYAARSVSKILARETDKDTYTDRLCRSSG